MVAISPYGIFLTGYFGGALPTGRFEGQGAAVSKDALMQRVWPNRIVEESGLHVQISTLRNAFGADRN
jgi:DNA-binding response OmpR family regulator